MSMLYPCLCALTLLFITNALNLAKAAEPATKTTIHIDDIQAIFHLRHTHHIDLTQCRSEPQRQAPPLTHTLPSSCDFTAYVMYTAQQSCQTPHLMTPEPTIIHIEAPLLQTTFALTQALCQDIGEGTPQVSLQPDAATQAVTPASAPSEAQDDSATWQVQFFAGLQAPSDHPVFQCAPLMKRVELVHDHERYYVLTAPLPLAQAKEALHQAKTTCAIEAWIRPALKAAPHDAPR